MTSPAEEKRFNDPIMMQLVTQIHESQIELDRKLTKHMTEETQELAQALAKLMNESFPGGDSHGHRLAHVAWIAEVEERTDFYRTMKKKLAEWGLIGFAGWALYSLWASFLQGPHK